MIDPNFISAVTGGPFRFVVLVELITVGNQPIRLTTDTGETVYNSNTYYPSLIDNISTTKSSSDINDTGISVKLSGIDDALLSIVSADNFVNSQCKVYLLAQEYNENPTVNMPYINEGVFLLFDGVVAAPPSLAFGGETSISIAIQSRMVAKDKNRSERYADADQQKKYAGDLGMQYATEVGNKSVRWPAASWFGNQE